MPAVPAAATPARAATRPSVTSVSPGRGPLAGGTRITVRGAHFRSVESVTVGGVAARHVHVVSGSKLVAIVPRHLPGRYDVRVRTAAGRSARTGHDRYQYVRPPSVTRVRLVQGSGLRGSTVRVSGRDLGGATAVRFGGALGQIVRRSSSSVDVRVPPNSPGRLHVTVATAGGTSAHRSADVYPMPTPSTQRWNLQTYLGLEQGHLADLSCPNPTTCVAVDSRDAVWTITDGIWSSPTHLAAAPYPAFPQHVSCPTTDFCVVAGNTHAYVLDNGTWSVSPAEALGDALADVSCPAAGSCALVTETAYRVLAAGSWSAPKATPADLYAVDCYADLQCIAVGQSGGRGVAYAFDGSTWTELTSLLDDAGVVQLSCASATLCALEDFLGRVSVWDGAAWSTPAAVDPSTGDNTNRTRVSCVGTTCIFDGHQSVYTYSSGDWTKRSASTYSLVGCATPTACVGEDDFGHIGTFDGTGWHATTQQLDLVGPASSMDCTSASFCAMTDESGNAYVYDGTGWSAPHRITDTSYQPSSVSCATTTFCLAVFADRTAARYDGAGWTHLAGPLRAQAALSCTAPTNCIAVGPSDAERFDGAAWHVVRTGVKQLAVSCASTTFCAIVTPDGVDTFDGTRWHSGLDDAQLWNVDAHSVSCPSSSFCLAVDGVGREIVYRDGAWSSPQPTLIVGPTTVSCYSATFCQSFGMGASQTFDGRYWSAVNRSGPAADADELSALSCYGVQTCMAAEWGLIFSSQPA